VGSTLELRHIDFVAIVAGVLFLGVGRLDSRQPEQQQGYENSEGFAHWSHHVS